MMLGLMITNTCCTTSAKSKGEAGWGGPGGVSRRRRSQQQRQRRLHTGSTWAAHYAWRSQAMKTSAFPLCRMAYTSAAGMGDGRGVRRRVSAPVVAAHSPLENVRLCTPHPLLFFAPE